MCVSASTLTVGCINPYMINMIALIKKKLEICVNQGCLTDMKVMTFLLPQ